MFTYLNNILLYIITGTFQLYMKDGAAWRITEKTSCILERLHDKLASCSAMRNFHRQAIFKVNRPSLFAMYMKQRVLRVLNILRTSITVLTENVRVFKSLFLTEANVLDRIDTHQCDALLICSQNLFLSYKSTVPVLEMFKNDRIMVKTGHT